MGATAIGQEECPRRRATILGNPLRIGEGQDGAEGRPFTSPRLRREVGATYPPRSPDGGPLLRPVIRVQRFILQRGCPRIALR